MSLLGRCLPCVSRLPAQTRSVLAQCSTSKTPNERRSVSSKPPKEEKDASPIPMGGFYSLPDPVFDNVEEHFFEPSKRAPLHPDSHVIESNWRPMFFDLNDINNMSALDDLVEEDGEAEEGADKSRSPEGMGEEALSPLHHLPVPFSQLQKLFRFPLFTRRVVQQSGKGKIWSQYALTVVGNGNGLVGLGEGKAEFAPQAAEKAFAQAVRNLDVVERFEGRTLWTELETKFGATRLVMRPRPVGFGLMCAPGIHQVLKAAGIKDASVKILGSRNKINVVKAAIRVLHAGHAPLAMGNGIGGKGRKMEAGSGMRGKATVERERGRKILDARTL